MRLQIWRKMVNWDRVGLILCFFIPALWQGFTVKPTLFCQLPWDGCESTTIQYADVLSYTPPINFAGFDSISYTLTDGFGSSAACSVQVLVTSTNFQFVPIVTGPAPAGLQLAVERAPSTNVVIIEASSDLAHWESVFTSAPTQGTIQFLDASAAGLGRRF